MNVPSAKEHAPSEPSLAPTPCAPRVDTPSQPPKRHEEERKQKEQAAAAEEDQQEEEEGDEEEDDEEEDTLPSRRVTRTQERGRLANVREQALSQLALQSKQSLR